MNHELQRRQFEELSALLAEQDLERAEPSVQSAVAARLARMDEIGARVGEPVPVTLWQLTTEPEDPPELQDLIRINDANREWFCRLVADRGWPPQLDGISEAGADAAWTHAMHADKSNDARRGWLPQVLDAVGTGHTLPRQYAELVDRTQLAANLPQLFGTLSGIDGPYYWIEDNDATVDARRAEIGLPTLAEDRQAMRNGTALVTIRDEYWANYAAWAAAR